MKKSLVLLLMATVCITLSAQQSTNKASVAAQENSVASAKPAQGALKSGAATTLHSVALVPGPAVVVASNVNVRGQARLQSEVVTRINKGQEVTVLEEIVRNNSAANEPSAWAKILLPNNRPVWVKTSFVSNNVVVATRLNLRSGPGENYSVLGLLERGAEVKAVSTKEDWTQIEAPANAYAFVASQYLKQEPGMVLAAATPTTQTDVQSTAPATGTTSTAENPATHVTETPATTTVPETPTTAEKVEDAPIVAPAKDEPMTVASNSATNNSTASGATNAALASHTVAENVATPVTDTNTMPEEVVEEPPPKRIVQREGVVRGTVSIQAPSHFALVSADSGRLINYLYTSSPSLDLRRYKGLRVIVTGEEAIEERWGNTPVITIQKLEMVDE